MQTVKSEVKGTTLILTVDLTQRRGPSKSGKSELIVCESGRVAGLEGVKFGVNVYKVLPKKVAA